VTIRLLSVAPLSIAVLLAVAPGASAQAKAPAAPAAQVQPQGYDYHAEGRRDPFVSLMRRGAESKSAPVNRPGGIAGMTANDISLRGVVVTGDQFLAIVHASDNKTYIVHAGQRLLDGTIRSIGRDSMVILQLVRDPLGAEKQRELHKVLHQEEAR
jgi:Tfp pilus assembly protein PilP